MYKRIDLPDNAFKTYEVDSTSFRLRIGDRVDPQTMIGRDFRTGEMITANCWGYVTGISPNPLNHLLLVAVSGKDELRWANVPSYEQAFNGF